MKKILAIALALVLVLSMGMVALAEDPVAGSSENYPISVPSPDAINNTMVTVAANSTLWYSLPSEQFQGATLELSYGLTKVTVDGTEFLPSKQLMGGIAAELNPRKMVMSVGFVNETDEEVTVFLTVSLPKGTSMDTAEELYTGETMFNLDGSILPYYYAYSSYDIAGKLKISVEADCADYELAIFDEYGSTVPAKTAMPEGEKNETYLEIELDTYSTVYVAIAPFGWVAGLITVEYEVPEEGTEENPVKIWGTYDLECLTVPANSTLYVTLYDILSSCVGAYVDKELVTATVDGEEISFIEGGENAPYSVTIALTNDSDEDVVAPLWLEYPAGTYENPEYIGNGETKLNATAYSYYYTYIALNDGKLTVKVDSIDTIAGLSLENIIVRDPDYDGSNYEKYFDYMGNHADKDENGDTVYDEETYLPVYSSPSQYYATIEVSKGDEVVISIEGGKFDDEGNLIPMDATLTVDGPQAPVGHYENMDKFEVGKNSFTISGEDVLYCGTWTAPANGTITVNLVGDVYEFAMGEMETEDPVIMSETDKLVLKVKKGEQIAFMAVAGMDETTGEFVDTDVELTLDFVEDKEDSPATGATGATAAVLLTLVSAAGLAVLSKKRNA